MKALIGVVSCLIGGVFLYKAFGWEDNGTVFVQILKWCVSGFGIQFILSGLFFVACGIKDSETSGTHTTVSISHSAKAKSDSSTIFHDKGETERKNSRGDDFEPWKY